MVSINYGNCLRDEYVKAGQVIIADVEQGAMSRTVEMINTAFFNGGSFSPKSFHSLTVSEFPRAVASIPLNGVIHTILLKEEQVSWSDILTYIEAIPVIGTVIAIISAVAHIICMWSSFSGLKSAVANLKKIHPENSADFASYTNPAFDAAVNYTMHQNYLYGSLLSLIPLAKPITRVFQWAMHTAAPPEEEKVESYPIDS